MEDALLLRQSFMGGRVNTSSTLRTAPSAVRGQERATERDVALGVVVAALLLLFWVPNGIITMQWPEFWILFLTEVYIWGLFAVAFNLLMGYTGLVSFGQAAYLGIGGYATGLLLKKIAGFPFALALLAAPVASALAALIIGSFCVRRTQIYFAMLTLAFGQIIYFTAFKWYDFTGGDNGLIGVPIPQWITSDATFTNYYRFVLVIVLVCLYILWRIVHSPFGKTLTALRENAERAAFIGINVKRYQLYAFIIAGAFSGIAGALFTINERSVYPELAFWTRSTQVLLMSLLGGVYTFFGPIVGALLLQAMDADITQNYPEIWQMFLGSVLVLILFGLPGGVIGFILARDVASSDDYATRMQKTLQTFCRKFWYFFFAMLFFTAFFSVLQTPDAWWSPIKGSWGAPLHWGIVPRTIAQTAIGLVLFPVFLRGLRTFSPFWRYVLCLVPLAFLLLHFQLHTPLSGMLIVLLWGVFVYSNLFQADVRQAFRREQRMALRMA